MTESRFSARQTSPSLLAQAEIAPGMIVSGYLEFDFLGATEVSNGIESNSYAPRMRNMYVSLDWKDPGVHVLAGQAWTLLMLQGKGLDPRNIVTAPFIDADFIPGQLWERGAQVRFVKDLGPFTAGISFENPQNYFQFCPGASGLSPTTVGVAATNTTGYGRLAGTTNVFCQSTGGQFMGNLNNYSFNRIPDIVGKLAWDGNLGGDHPVHTELMGYYTDLYDQISYWRRRPSERNRRRLHGCAHREHVGLWRRRRPRRDAHSEMARYRTPGLLWPRHRPHGHIAPAGRYVQRRRDHLADPRNHVPRLSDGACHALA